MTERKPYLLRALYDWIVDNNCTPHLIVAYPAMGWVSGVPEHLLQDEILVLNISPLATQHLQIDADACSFHTRFQGHACQVSIALPAIHAIIARENGEGMQFDIDEAIANGPIKSTGKESKKDSLSHLKIIK